MKVHSSQIAQVMLRTNRLAPIFSIAVMIGASFLMAHPVSNEANVLAHRARIADEMSLFPFQLDGWHGRDVPIPTAAEEILRPNSVVSRVFTELGTNNKTVLALIHCSDIRDMVGHHPPHCYPAAGWSIDVAGTQDLAIKLAGETVLMRSYRFRRLDKIGIEQQQAVLSMFLLPDSRRLTDMNDLRASGSQGRRASAMGVAQLQLVYEGNPTDRELTEVANALLRNFPQPLLDALDAPVTDSFDDSEMPLRQDRGRNQ